MYESPIQVTQTVLDMVAKETEDKVVITAQRALGIDIDKDRLIKALKYDSDMYHKGYADALEKYRWIPREEYLLKDGTNVLVTVHMPTLEPVVRKGIYVDHKFILENTHTWLDTDEEVTAWMYSPAPYL